MGVFYSAIPLDEENRQWLSDEDIAAPDEDGKPPTPGQLKKILGQLKNQNVEFNIKKGVWQADISDLKSQDKGPWTLLNVLDYSNAKTPCRFGFDKGSPELIIEIVHRIAQTCGPIVVVPDTGCPPIVVEANSDPSRIVESWEHING